MYKSEQSIIKPDEKSPLTAPKSATRQQDRSGQDSHWVMVMAIVLITVVTGGVVMVDFHNEKQVVHEQTQR